MSDLASLLEKVAVDDLAQIIRRVDGNHSLGAGQLAEAILAALSPPIKAGEAGHIANCCICGRVVDTRERTEGGDAFGVELEDGRWTCSTECWDSAVGDAHPIKAGEAVPVGWILPQRLDAPFLPGNLTEHKLRQRAKSMLDAGHADDADLDIEAADLISALERELEEARALNNKYAALARSALQSEKDREGQP
jgi:hypothetical protein